VVIIHPPLKGSVGVLSRRDANAQDLKRSQPISLKRIARRQWYVSRRDATCRFCGRYASGLPAVVLEDC